MKKRMKGILLVSVLLTLTIALSACSGDKAGDTSGSEAAAVNNTGSETADESSITIGIPQDLEESLDPHKATAAGTTEILFNIFEGLVKPDENGNLINAIASDYTISEDGLVYTFTL